MCSVEQRPLFRDLTGEDPDPEVTQIESLCMNCHANGMTRLLLTRIPYYKNVVIMSFSCEECGYENNEIQPGGEYAEKGVKWTLKVKEAEDLNRQVVKSDYTSIKIPELDFEIPAQSQKGEVTTVEGLVTRAIAGLTQDQEARRLAHPEAAAQIDAFVDKMKELTNSAGKLDWTLILDDISGNCFLENPVAPRKDPRSARRDYKRTAEQNHTLGIFTHEEVTGEQESILKPSDPAACTYEQLATDSVLTFGTDCPSCGARADTNCKLTDIPYFKQVLIMATVCDFCGNRTNEVKSGGGIEEKGVKFELRVNGKQDFSRDVLKSETCCLAIPELELDVGGRALGGRFSTAEGLLRAVSEQLGSCPGVFGDAPGDSAPGVRRLLDTLERVLQGERGVTLVLDDPAGNSYVQSLNDDNPDEPDDGLKITRYERTFEQNEELGLNDMKTEGYEQDN